jgi:hypothetical protein
VRIDAPGSTRNVPGPKTGIVVGAELRTVTMLPDDVLMVVVLLVDVAVTVIAGDGKNPLDITRYITPLKTPPMLDKPLIEPTMMLRIATAVTMPGRAWR